MDMTSTAEASRWYGNQRLPGSPNSALSAHQNAGGSAGSVDASEMSAYYALENSNAHRRYYSAAAAGYSPHSKYHYDYSILSDLLRWKKIIAHSFESLVSFC
jgi:hypothetical protein